MLFLTASASYQMDEPRQPVSYHKVRAVPLGSKVSMARLTARAMEQLGPPRQGRSTLLLINNSGGAMCCAGSRYPKPATETADLVAAGGAGASASSSSAAVSQLKRGRGKGKRATVNAIVNATFTANGQPLAANRYPAIRAMDRAANRTDEYVAEVLRAKFVLSPPGLGYDCFRSVDIYCHETTTNKFKSVLYRQTQRGLRTTYLHSSRWAGIGRRYC